MSILLLVRTCIITTLLVALNKALAVGPAVAHSVVPGSLEHVYPAVEYGTGHQAELVKRGEYLAKAGDCIACHTTPGGRPFSGGLPIETPFGTFYSPNITPDRATGIGGWTDKEFVRSMQKGIRPDGSHNFPVYPYLYFTRVTTQDLLAIRAYLNALPPVRQVNRSPDVPWPFRWRFGQFFWKILFFDFYQGVFKPDPNKSDLWNRGAYLVEGLGHCGMCHTPINILGGPKRRYAYTGGMVDGYYAPNISGGNLKNVPIEKIVNVFKKDQLYSAPSKVKGPMLNVNHDSLRYLSQRDLTAIAVYLKSTKTHLPASAKTGGKISSTTGKRVYVAHCAACHTTGAGGAPVIIDHAVWAPRIAQGLKQLYAHAIKGYKSMPAKGTCMTCSDAEIRVAVDYMIAQSGGHTAVSTKPAHPAPRRLTLQDGQAVYEKACAVCHDVGHLGAPKTGDIAAWVPLIKKNMDVLVRHSIRGYKGMPARGACYDCSDAEIKAAVKYMVEKSKKTGDYRLW